jgi:hypothetical protein
MIAVEPVRGQPDPAPPMHRLLGSDAVRLQVASICGPRSQRLRCPFCPVRTSTAPAGGPTLPRNGPATSILIIVGIVLETMKQIDSQLMMRNYEGFLR